MGFNSTVIIINDALDQIAGDPAFGKNLVQAIAHCQTHGGRVDVSAGNHCNAAAVIETHHADQTALVAMGGNYGSVLGMTYGWAHHERAQQEILLRRVAEQFGYGLVKDPSAT